METHIVRGDHTVDTLKAYAVGPQTVPSGIRTLLTARTDCISGHSALAARIVVLSTTNVVEAAPASGVGNDVVAHNLACNTPAHLYQRIAAEHSSIRPVAVNLEVEHLDSGRPSSPDGTGDAAARRDDDLCAAVVSGIPLR
jgi:hypothetical protein